MQQKRIGNSARERLVTDVSLFLTVLVLAFFALPAFSEGRESGCGKSNSTNTLSAYNWQPAPVYSVGSLVEDPIWQHFSKRGQAFTDCAKPRPIVMDGRNFVPPKTKRASVKKAAPKTTARKKEAKPVTATPVEQAIAPVKQTAAKSQAVPDPCVPMLMPMPTLICPDPVTKKTP